MNRDLMMQRIEDETRPWDVAVIGGGATGVGIAVDAASRGYRVVLVEQSDFGKGTSSRSTKLVHGGIRYLQQGNVSLVIEALKERGLMLHNAPHLVHDLAFVVPNYQWWEAPFYGIGLKVYDLLAGKYGFGQSRLLSSEEVLSRIPTLERDGLRGGVLYHDGQFDDSRMLIHLARTAVEQGAVVLNYARVVALTKDSGGFLTGLVFCDEESGREHSLEARCVINATGPFTDATRRLDDKSARDWIAASQGVHITLNRLFLPGDTAIMVPRTADGRVMFAIPWLGHTLVGTTDTPVASVDIEPRPLPEEIDFLLETASGYLERTPGRSDVLSAFAGIRPLVKTDGTEDTAALSRDHIIEISRSGLLTVAGGKWTTYRRMAETAVDHAIVLGHLDERPCVTRELRTHGYQTHAAAGIGFSGYGSDAATLREWIQTEPTLGERLHPDLAACGAQVRFAVRNEMARTLDDVLARRTRALQLNARATVAMAPVTARLMAQEMGRDQTWEERQVEEFSRLARNYMLTE
jgi:glycerol-3-phosphate dehydrogenase